MMLIAIVGPTASGKSSLAISLAKKFSGEIISADSRQVYRGMDIGTGKVTKEEMEGVPHHLLDIANPKTVFTVADFVSKAEKTAQEIWKHKKIPIVCGGTGFYVDSFIRGTSIPNVLPNKKLREELRLKTVGELFLILKNLDPRRAREIDIKNPVRLIRAIEIATELGKVPKVKTKPIVAKILWIGIRKTKEELKKLIWKRLIDRIDNGLVREVETLHKRGVSWKRMKELGLEYRFTAMYLRGSYTKNEYIKKLAHAIEQYAKRQETWFKKNKEIHWIKNEREAVALMEKFLS